MNKILLKLTLVLFTVLAGIGLNRVYAASTPYEFHADAKMHLLNHGPVDHTYGYLHVVSDALGNSLVDVMFSNGNPRLRALFNARVRFLGTAGVVIREASFQCRLGTAGADSASECKVSKRLTRTAFESVQVDFFLTDLPDENTVAGAAADVARNFQ